MNTFDEYVKLYERSIDPDPGFEDSVDEKAEIQQANDFTKKFKAHLKAFKLGKKFKSLDDMAIHVDKALVAFDKDWNAYAKNNDRLYGLRLYYTFKKIEKAYIKACMQAAAVVRDAGSFVLNNSINDIEWEQHDAVLPTEMLNYYRTLPTAQKSKVFLAMLEKLKKLDDAIPYDANLSRVRKPLL
jgi:hypothetical protein